MQDEEVEIRKTLHFHILFQIAPFLNVFPSSDPPKLGEDFAISARKLFDAISANRSKSVKHLSGIPLDELLDGFTERGLPKTPEQKTWCSQQREDFITRIRSLSVWQLALLDPDRTFAKYDYWAKAAYFSLDEILWLSVGLEPLPEFIRAVDRPSQSATQRDPVVTHIMAQRELFRRSLDPNDYGRRQTAQSVLNWANRVQHELHPGFRRMLEAMVQREVAPDVGLALTSASLDVTPVGAVEQQVAQANGKPDQRLDPRERLGMAKLLVAVAIEQFGYDPDSKRSPIPIELQDIAARLGLEISRDTILKYLRLGAQHLPNGWRPHERLFV
ncbi:hypothetical protein [Tabrizicola sp. BL-A-41-H6]|uniref:hypothetical protein n=1 Tax=Tabrizicola sp. BL-A-41-H6 TaxID=3421107 RepID=UPI003D66EFC5